MEIKKIYKINWRKQNAIEVLKETVETIEVVDGNTKISFSIPKDSSKDEIYKELVLVLKEGGCKLKKYNLISYDLDIDNWGNEFIVNSEEKDRLIILYEKEEGNIINWSGKI